MKAKPVQMPKASTVIIIRNQYTKWTTFYNKKMAGSGMKLRKVASGLCSRKILLTAVVTQPVLLAPSPWAQDGDMRLEEVLVTAQKRTESLQGV
jgi:hypothetical protein